jgi:hypothetical protein
MWRTLHTFNESRRSFRNIFNMKPNFTLKAQLQKNIELYNIDGQI